MQTDIVAFLEEAFTQASFHGAVLVKVSAGFPNQFDRFRLLYCKVDYGGTLSGLLASLRGLRPVPAFVGDRKALQFFVGDQLIAVICKDE